MASEGSDAISADVHDLVLSDFRVEAQPEAFPSKPLWDAVQACGTELWLDTGDLDESASLWCSEFSGLTTNNTLLNREVQKGIYDDLISRVARALRRKARREDLVMEIAFVLNAHHGLRLSRRFGARVSVELHTDLAHDAARTVDYGRRFHAIAPKDFIVKVPWTPAGLLAARRLSDERIPVNFTLGFSARQNYLIASFARPAFVNVFLGRLNSFVADYGLGSGEMVGEKATLASQRAVRQLRVDRGLPTRQIAASMRNGGQIVSLAGVDVFTMPPKAARELESAAPDSASLSPQVENDPAVDLAEGVDREALGIDKLWEVSDDFRSMVRGLTRLKPGELSPAALRSFVADEGLSGLLPKWSTEDIETITADGKIPVYEKWAERLASGDIALDTLMNVSALQAFVSDQKAMDDRIRSML